MKLIPIPREKYNDYRLKLMFDCYKWDPQFLDHNTVARYALVLTKQEQEELARLTEALDRETRAAEEFLNQHQELAKPLALPKSVSKEIKQMKNYEPDKHVRLMRYDFHPTVDGTWAVSEVNSDVPGGFAESSFMPAAAIDCLSETTKTGSSEVSYWYPNFGEIMVEAIAKKVPEEGRIMMVHCTCYSDDRQVMQFLGDRLEDRGFQVIYGAADHLNFRDHKAYSILDGNEGKIDAIFRFTPLEWLTEIKPKRWEGYFDTTTVSCNHPVAMYAQTKRFPLIWDVLEANGVSLSTWRALLPETLEVKDAKGKEGFIYKPACGRVGEKISIKEACSGDEYQKILAEVKKHPKKYLAQKKFISKPLVGENGEEFHVCLGSYTVEGKHAGFYARISDTPRIDSNAADIPVLVESAPMDQVERDTAGSQLATLSESGRMISGEESRSFFAKQIYQTWAPAGKKWVDWVRPVPFMAIINSAGGCSFSDFTILDRNFIPEDLKDAAVIVDLPGMESIKEGLALAKAGYRPIPIYNGTMEQTGAKATVNNQSVAEGLVLGASILEEQRLDGTEIKDDALPAFLTDSNRMNRFKRDISLFDNSWDVYHQDLPSADYFLKSGIRKILIIGEAASTNKLSKDKISPDLKKILYPFQKKGITIYFMERYGTPQKIIVRKPIGKEKD